MNHQKQKGTTNTKEFADIFKTLRKDKGMTQGQISEVLGVSPHAISRWENGVSHPDIAALPSIASFFDVSVDALLGVPRPVIKQKLVYFQFRWQESADIINEWLEDGRKVKEMHTHPLDEGQHLEGVVLLEKAIMT